MADPIKHALEVMDNHILALNAHDEAALAKTLHFPHIKIWPTAESYFTDFQKRAGGGWHHSAFNDIQVLAHSENKVHLDAEIIRYDVNNEIISRFRSLWILTNEGGAWAAKMRSSFAQK